MEVTTYKCDVCGVVKGEANHWWKGIIFDGPQIAVQSWDVPTNPGDPWKHLCGESCVHTWMTKAMQEGA